MKREIEEANEILRYVKIWHLIMIIIYTVLIHTFYSFPEFMYVLCICYILKQLNNFLNVMGHN